MKQRPLTTGWLSICNLRRKPFRTACLIIVVAVMASTLFGGSILSGSLKNGLSSLKERLGADLAVVPLEHESEYEGIILSGEPSRFYFDKSIEQQIARVQGVAQVTSHFYISTLAADCCSVPVQIIGFNPDTDFVTQPLIAKAYDRKIGDGQLIVGSDIIVDETDTLKFFNNPYTVVAQLDKTSTGMDYSVYATMNTIKSLVDGAHSVGLQLNIDVQDGDMVNSISSVLVKAAEGYDADAVATNIRRSLSGISIVKSKSIFSGIANNLDVLLTVVSTVMIALWIVAILILAVLFSVTINGRKKEFAIFRTLGATRKKLISIVLAESFFASAAGGVLGAGIASLMVFPFSTYIGERLNLPYLQPPVGVILEWLALSLLLSFAAGPLAAIYSALKISRADTYLTIREGE